MEKLSVSFFLSPPVTVNLGQSAAGTDGKSIEASDLYYRSYSTHSQCV